MSRLVIVCLISFILLLLLSTQIQPGVNAQSISSIGNLNFGETKQVTVSGLTANKTYFWRETKQTSAVPNKDYTIVYSACYDSDSDGVIQKEVGPFGLAGKYILAIYEKAVNECKESGRLAASQEFTVGGPTEQDCCTGPTYVVYDLSKDVCKQTPLLPPNPVFNPSEPTKCKAQNTYCEPQSLKCFESKTFVSSGKICKNPKEPGFDKDKHAICGVAGGDSCSNDPKNPGIQTAIGCIHTSPVGFTRDLLRFVLGIGGGLAFLMMLLGAFQMLTSAGNPETLAAGRERLTSAVI
ncbi:hypothetical protein HYS94_04265, partial [Candidatus Daviesbacteria bacterium]|nr:hypothetical protein [Candidatus Daviesbacteria bacterium]